MQRLEVSGAVDGKELRNIEKIKILLPLASNCRYFTARRMSCKDNIPLN
jgi:hypothetical protein